MGNLDVMITYVKIDLSLQSSHAKIGIGLVLINYDIG
jgi:hypothetical protein